MPPRGAARRPASLRARSATSAPAPSVSVDITVTVDDTVCGSIANVAHVSATNETGEATENNTSNEVTNSVECEEPSPPDLQVTKTSDAEGLLHEDDEFHYTITVTNVGDEVATGVRFLDELPPGEALFVAIPPFPTFDGDACTIASSTSTGGITYTTVQCGPITLDPGESASVTIRVVVAGDVCGSITNVVDVEGGNEPAANVGPDNHAEATDEVACEPRIRLQKGGPSLAHVGDTVTYVFTVTNTGGVDLSDIDLTDPRCDGTPALTDDGDGDTVLAVGENWSFECDHTVVAGDGDPVHNVATVTGDHDEGTVSDTDTHDVDVIHPDIDLEKTATPDLGPGRHDDRLHLRGDEHRGYGALRHLGRRRHDRAHRGHRRRWASARRPSSRPRSPSAPPPSPTSPPRRAPTSSACP